MQGYDQVDQRKFASLKFQNMQSMENCKSATESVLIRWFLIRSFAAKLIYYLANYIKLINLPGTSKWKGVPRAAAVAPETENFGEKLKTPKEIFGYDI